MLTLLCQVKHRVSLKGSLKEMGLDVKFLHYFTAGRFSDVSNRAGRVSKVHQYAHDFVNSLRCNVYAGGDNCCSGPAGCNLPSKLNQTSFYASVGVNEIVAAYAQDAQLRAYLASAAGVKDLWQAPDGLGDGNRLGSGVADRHRSGDHHERQAPSGIVAAALGALAFVCLALLTCLIGGCYLQHQHRRRRRGSATGDNINDGICCLDSALKKAAHRLPSDTGEDPMPPTSGSFFSNSRQQLQHGAACGAAAHQRDSAAEKLLTASSTSASSSSAFNCPTPVGVAGDGRSSAGHQHSQRMFAVPNRAGAGSGCGSSGVGTGDSQPSTSWNSGCVVVPAQLQAKPTPAVEQTPDTGAASKDNSHTGSGSGQPILLPRTVAREIEHRELIGQGRFGQVYRSEWRNDPVAVKIFSSRAESSWSTEGHMYELPGMRHDAILGFIAIDNIDIGLETQLWLITDYHANGSLQSYLTRCTVDQHTMTRMLHSIASGLAHLHSEISGVKCKPAIAHRDIKSNNILVKSDLSCCIADFGLAVALQPGCGAVVGFGSGGIGVGGSSDSGITDVHQHLVDNGVRVGTRRYLSPECLTGHQDARDFTALRKADVYAAGLVFWELAMRCDDPARGVTAVAVYQQPYHGLVPSNPTLEEMQAVVCPPASARPPLLPAWQAHPILERLCRVMSECWYPPAAARLEAMSVKDQTARMLQASVQLVAADKDMGGTVLA